MVSASWVFCDRCGCSVDVELIDDESHHYDALGDFYCADCWASGEPSPGTPRAPSGRSDAAERRERRGVARAARQTPTKAPSIEEGAFVMPSDWLRQSGTKISTQLHSAECAALRAEPDGIRITFFLVNGRIQRG